MGADGAVAWSNRPLSLLEEARLADLLDLGSDIEDLEASGVVARDAAAHVVFDNSCRVATVALSLVASPKNELRDGDGEGDDRVDGYEDLAWDPVARRWLLLVEALGHGGDRRPHLVEVTEDFDHVRTRPFDFVAPSKNKGFEGVACVHGPDGPVVLALCEGNWCESGRAGREPGGGRLIAFTEQPDGWQRRATVELPFGVAFEDYAAVAIDAGRIAVVSQASSAVWVGGFSVEELEVTDAGTVHRFPLEEGRIAYCTIEGVAWDGGRLVTVSDRAKRDHPRRCRGKGQSIQVWTVPVLTD